MKICVIGCGQVASWHFGRWVKHYNIGDITGAHFVDKKPGFAKNFASRWERRTNGNEATFGTEVTTDGIDFALVTSPNGLHYVHASPFIAAGIPVFIEKPIALNNEDLQLLADGETAGAWITCGFQLRYNPIVIELMKRAFDEKILYCHTWKYRQRLPSYYRDDWHGTWDLDGGVSLQQGIHAVDLMVAMHEDWEPDAVTGTTWRSPMLKDDMECDTTTTLFCDYGDHSGVVSMTVDADMNYDEGVELLTTQGLYRCSGEYDLKVDAWPVDQKAPSYKNSKDAMWYDIFDRLKTGKPPRYGAKDAIRSVRMINTLIEQRTGRPR